MSKLKKLKEVHERYNISLEHQFAEPTPGNKVPAIKATIVIPDETNTRFTKRVSTNFVQAESLQEAEKLAIDTAVDLLLGTKTTKKLTDNFKVFDLQLVPFAGLKTAPVGMKCVLNVCTEDGKPFRTTVSIATGTDANEVEAEVIKSAINAILGV